VGAERERHWCWSWVGEGGLDKVKNRGVGLAGFQVWRGPAYACSTSMSSSIERNNQLITLGSVRTKLSSLPPQLGSQLLSCVAPWWLISDEWLNGWASGSELILTQESITYDARESTVCITVDITVGIR
jgi:hypothetical protein